MAKVAREKVAKAGVNVDQLGRYNGRRGAPAFLACQGKVYDVSGSFLWQHGQHQVLYKADSDLTSELAQAPRGVEPLARFPVVGVLEREPATLRG
jgi:predicted heme/steroid binding protein